MIALRILGAMALFAVALSLPALAQSSTEVQIPLGSWINSASEFIAPVLAAAVLWMIRKLPGQVSGMLMAMRVDQLLVKAIDYAINATAGAARDKPLKVNVGNEVVAQAINYAVNHGPGWLLGWIGGEVVLREKIIARLNVDASAALK